MRSSKLLITSLLAAAAMSVPAFGVTTTTTELDGVTYSGTIWTTNVSATGVSSGDYLSSGNRTYTSGDLSYTGDAIISGTTKFWAYFFSASENTSLGNTLRLTGATANHTVTTDYRDYVWLGGLITDTSDYTYTIGRPYSSGNGSFFHLKGATSSGVNMKIGSNTTIWGDRGISVDSSGSWVIDAGKTLSLKSVVSTADNVPSTNGVATFATGTTTTVSGGGTLSFAECANLILNGSLSIGESTALDLSGTNVTLASAITNSGTVTVSSDTIFALDGLTASDGVYSLVSGGTVTNTAGDASFSLGGVTIASSRVSISTTSGYTATFRNYSDLVWAGTTDSVWSIADEKKNWTSATAGSDPIAFANGDSVTFGAGTDNSVTIAENLIVGTLTTSAATTLSVADGSTATVSASALSLGANLTLNSGVTLKMTQTATGSDNVTNMFSNVAGTGTLSIILPDGNGLGVNAPNFAGTLYIQKPSGSESRLQLTSTTLADGASIELADGADLVLNATMERFSHDIKINGETDLYFNSSSSASVEFSGNITGAGTLSIVNTNTRTLVLSGDVDLGGISVGSNKSLTILGTANINALAIAGGEIAVTGAGVLNGSISSMANGTKLTLAGTNASTVAVTGTIGTATLDIQNGSLTWTHNGANRTSGANITIGAGSTFKDEADYKYSLTLSGKLSGAGTLYSGVPTIEGQGDGFRTVTLSGSTADFTGEWQLETASADSGGGNRRIDGVLNSSDGVFGGVVSFTTLQGTTVDEAITSSKLSLAKDMEIGGLKGTLSNTVVGSNDTNSRALTINTVADANYDYAGTIASTISGITKKGTGTQTLAGASTAFNGSVTVSGGVLALADAAAIGTGNAVRIEGGQLKVGNGTTAVSLNAAAYTIVLSDAYSADSGTGVAAIIGTSETNKSSVALTADTKITIDDIAVSIAAEAAQYQYKIFDTTTIDDGTFTVNNFALSTSLESIGWAISGYNAGVLTLTIPEPSVFGLLAGLGALALAGTRRRRRKA